jgi:pyruvate,water dikinase
MTESRNPTSDSTEIPAGFWQRETSHYPKPLTPLGASVLLEWYNRSWPKILADFGAFLETLELREIRGHVYLGVRPLGSTGSGPNRTPPAPILWLLFRIHPAFRRRTARCKQAMLGREDRGYLDRWFSESRPRLQAEIERYRAVDLTSLSDEDLSAHLRELRHWALAAAELHFYLHVAIGFPLARLAFFCRDQLGYDDSQTVALLSGLSSASSEPALELAKLADHLRADPELAEAVLAARAEDVPELLGRSRGEAAERFDEYLNRYCFRALRYEVVEDCLIERPELVASLLQDQLRGSADLAEEQRRLASVRSEAKSRALLALQDDARKLEFEELLADAERAYPVREDNEFFTVSVPLALIRFAVIEAGKRLAARNALPGLDDVFFLALGEVIDALTNAEARWEETVSRRREEHEAAKSFDPPASHGEEPPAPPLSVLPPEPRLAMEVQAYVTRQVFEPDLSGRREESRTRELRGVAASRGTYTGPARIVMGEEQFDRLQAGDVLVCPVTSPVWSVLFAKVGALVTDSGGILSHPAIIAREYGVPAVVATGNATQVINDGQQVVVDGESGIVRLVDPPRA